MGFGDVLGKLAGNVVNKVQEENKKYSNAVEKYERYSDEALFKKLKNKTDRIDKIAIAKVLKSRGYGNDDIQ